MWDCEYPGRKFPARHTLGRTTRVATRTRVHGLVEKVGERRCAESVYGEPVRLRLVGRVRLAVFGLRPKLGVRLTG